MTIMRASSHRMIECHLSKFIDQTLIALLGDMYCSCFFMVFSISFYCISFRRRGIKIADFDKKGRVL